MWTFLRMFARFVVILICLGPIVFLIIGSVSHWNPITGNPDSYVGLSSFSELIRYGNLDALSASMIRAFIVASCSVVIAAPLGYALMHYAFRWVRMMTFVVIGLPLIANSALRAYGWTEVLGQRGFLHRFYDFSPSTERLRAILMYHQAGAIVTLTLAVTPGALFIVAYWLDKIPKDLMWGMQDLGAGGWRQYLTIGIRESVPALLVGWAVCFVQTIGSELEPRLIGGQNCLTYVYSLRSLFSDNERLGEAFCLALGAVAICAIVTSAAYAGYCLFQCQQSALEESGKG